MYCIFLGKTYSIRDVYFYDPLTSDSGHWTYPSGMSKSYSSDGLSISSSGDLRASCDITTPTNFKVSFKIKCGASDNLRYFAIDDWNISNGKYQNVPRLNLYNIWPPNYYVNNSYSANTLVEMEIEYNNGSITIKKDGITLITQSISLTNRLLQLYSGGNVSIIIKDLIVEEL